MSREINPEKSSASRSMSNRESVPLPSLRLRQAPSIPVKVKLLVSEKFRMPQPAPPGQALVSEQLPSPPEPRDRRRVKVLITDRKPFWRRPPRQSMPPVHPQPTRSWQINLLVTTLLISAVMGVSGGGFLAVQFILNPAALGWIPGSKPIAAEHSAQTFKEIQAEAYRAGVFAGTPLYISTYPGFQKGALGQDDFLLPMYASAMLENLSELRVYRALKIEGKTVFELKDRIAIEGPSEADAIAPLTASAQMIQGSDRLLALSEVDFVEGKAPAPGIWLQISGEWARSGSQVVYGRVLHYDPLRTRFHTLLTWTSPAGELPHWQQITGNPQTELWVNQTVGLEPHFQVYQLKAQKSRAEALQLEAIALTQPALQGRTYENALLLAQNGLWAAARELLELVKQNNAWSAAAQAQLDLVKLHAQATQVQADRTWASPTQQILALLMDGRWTKALSQLKTAHQNGYDIINFLHANADHLLPQIETSLIVHPGDADVLRWGTLMKAIQRNNHDAVIWLQKHQAPADLQQILALLNLPGDNTFIEPHNELTKPRPKPPSKVAAKRPTPDRPTPAVMTRLRPPSHLGAPTPMPSPQPIAPSPIQAPAPPEVQPVMESPANLQTPFVSPEVPKPVVQPPIDPKHSEF
jgi:hypothetical protein